MKIASVLAVFGMGVLGVACSPNASSNLGCKTQGFFTDETSCVSASGGSCTLTSVASAIDSKTLICWKPSASGLSLSTSTTGASTTSTSGCTGSYPWSMGPWIPAACSGGVTQLTRVVSCPHACPCNQPSTTMPENITNCTADLYNQIHYSKQCKDLGGDVIPMPDGDKICSLPGSACPSGWFAYGPGGVNWTATEMAMAQDQINCTGGTFPVYTAFHALGPLPIESKTYCGWRNCFKCRRWDKVYAKVTRVGCY
jgi:hypothetical protein